MEGESKERYYVGQHLDAFIETDWQACLVTSVKASQPPSYGIVTIEKGRNFYLSPDSLRHKTERRLLVDDSFQEERSDFLNLNVSGLSSEGDSLFITPSNVNGDSVLSGHNDSLFDFAKQTQEFLTLTSSPIHRSPSPAVNGCQPQLKPTTEQCGTASLAANTLPSDIGENSVPEDLELDEALALVDEDFLTTSQDLGSPIRSDSNDHKIPKKSNVRFAEVDEQEIQNLQKAAKSDRTHKQTQWAIKILTDWLAAANRPKDFSLLTDDDLGKMLTQFYASARNKDGELYSKASLQCIRASIQRFLQGPPYYRVINVISGAAFVRCNSVIQGMIKKMRKDGLDKTTRHTPIPPEHLKLIYASGAFLLSTPTTLQYKVFFELSLHFGRRGREGLRELKTDMIKIEISPSGQEYATLTCQSHEKNYQGTGSHDSDGHDQRMYSTGRESCPVASLKSYISHLNPDCPWFFQRPKTTNYKGKVIWYCSSAVGKNAIANYMPRICTSANLTHRYTNHCIRATAVTTLREAGVAPNDIQAVTRHKSLASIDHYSKVSNKTRSVMSAELAKACSPEKTPPKTSPKRQLYTGKYSKSTTVICTPAKGRKGQQTEGDIVQTVTVETEKTSMQDATAMAKNILSGAVFNAPVTLNFTFK